MLSFNGTSFVSTSTIGNNQLANSALTVSAGSGLSGGGSISLGGSTSLSLNLNNANSWTGLQSFANATSTLFSVGTIWDTGLANALLSVDQNGKVVATSSIGVNLLSGTLGVGNGGTGVSIPSVAGFPVEAYGAVGNGTTDDSAAIQSAINAACGANGGRVIFGAKIYAIASGLTIACSNIYLVGQGAGGPAVGDPSAYTDTNHLGATVLKWTGSAGGAMVTFQPANNAAVALKGGGIDDLVLAGYGVAGTGLKLRSIRGATFPRLTIENVTSVGVDMNVSTTTIQNGDYDTQQNNFGQLYIMLYWNMLAVINTTGVLMDGTTDANTSFNVFNDIYLSYESGTGVEFANADSNTIGTLRAFQPSPELRSKVGDGMKG